jgi:glyoxylase-like metal-dependent hydrolase (beta-lactamase superfamily II)
MESSFVESVRPKADTGKFSVVTPDVVRICHHIVNSYMISDPGSGRWVLVDAGLRTSWHHIRAAAEERFGKNAQPDAIILTHGHFDHVGALHSLLKHWDVPVYAHRMEFPYLTGMDSYPPADPNVGGGMMAVMSRFFTRGPIDLGDRIHVLPKNGTVPGLTRWRWIHTPGHSPGHISLFDDADRVLIAGDAFVTTRQESALAVLSQRQELNGPPAYFTPDWPSARSSVRALAALSPRLAATGHGKPMEGPEFERALAALALRFNEIALPRRGRYVFKPAVMDVTGVRFLPPPLPRRVPKAALAGMVLLTLAGAAVVTSFVRRRRNARS